MPAKKKKTTKFQFDTVMLAWFTTILIVIFSGISVMLYMSRGYNIVNEYSYQAVFLTNGQVYFGKLDSLSHRSFSLTDVYYVQEGLTAEEGEEESAAPTQFNVVRLGNELHQPENAMVINRDHVLFWENLRTDSQVIQAINEQKNQ